MQEKQKSNNSPQRPDTIDRRLSVAPIMDWRKK